MANATPTRLGQNLATGDANALFLKIFSGEVLSAFGRENQMMNMTTVRNIQNGKSASFPVTGRITADYHTAGNEILGSTLLTLHNLNFYQELMTLIRENIKNGTFDQFHDKFKDKL